MVEVKCVDNSVVVHVLEVEANVINTIPVFYERVIFLPAHLASFAQKFFSLGNCL